MRTLIFPCLLSLEPLQCRFPEALRMISVSLSISEIASDDPLYALKVRAAFKHKTKVWSLASSSARNTNVKPFNSDLVSAE